MSDQPSFFPSRDAPGFKRVEIETDGPRAVMPPHYVLEEGRMVLVAPAGGITLGTIADEHTGGQMPALRMRSAMAPAALVYVMLPAELRFLGEAMIEQADEMERDAAAAAADIITRGWKGGQG